jgi:hypothetical protein
MERKLDYYTRISIIKKWYIQVTNENVVQLTNEIFNELRRIRKEEIK